MPVTNTAASTTAVTILAENKNRANFLIFNDSADATMYFKYGTGTTTSDHTLQVLPGNYFEPSVYTRESLYKGEITAVWGSASGSSRATEW